MRSEIIPRKVWSVWLEGVGPAVGAGVFGVTRVSSTGEGIDSSPCGLICGTVGVGGILALTTRPPRVTWFHSGPKSSCAGDSLAGLRSEVVPDFTDALGITPARFAVASF